MPYPNANEHSTTYSFDVLLSPLTQTYILYILYIIGLSYVQNKEHPASGKAQQKETRSRIRDPLFAQKNKLLDVHPAKSTA